MLIWINGPFGVGKTSVAEELLELVPDALLYDPELVGMMLRQIVEPVDAAPDFQDLVAWPALVAETARVLRKGYCRTLVMPMTVWRRDYFEDLSARLRTVDRDLHVFRLTASDDVLRARILGRPDADGSHDWCLSHLPTGLELMARCVRATCPKLTVAMHVKLPR